MDEAVVMDLLERALAVDDAGSAMRLVAYDQVEVGQAELLGAGDHVDGLVGGEHHVQCIVAVVETGCNGVRGRGGGIRDVGQLAVALVVLELGRLAVRAYDVRVDAAAHLVDPATHGLGHEADGRCEEQDSASRAQFLRQTQRGESLAGAARHDCQRPVMILQLRFDRVDGLALVVARFEHLARVSSVAGEGAPVDVRVADPFQVDARDVTVLVVRDIRLEVVAHRGRCVRDDEMPVACVCHRRHEERGHVLVRQRVRIAFRLDRPILAVHVLRDQVDAGVLPARIRGRVIPQPHMIELVLPRWILGEEPLHGAFPFRALLALVHRLLDDAVENFIDTDGHG